jgi:hypothetical protein
MGAEPPTVLQHLLCLKRSHQILMGHMAAQLKAFPASLAARSDIQISQVIGHGSGKFSFLVTSLKTKLMPWIFPFSWLMGEEQGPEQQDITLSHPGCLSCLGTMTLELLCGSHSTKASLCPN